MSLQFSRSMRALKLDSFRASRIGMILAGIIMIALMLWFFLAQVTLYETSQELSFTNAGSVMVTFPQESVPRLLPGQPAVLRLDTGQDQATITIPALLVNIDYQSGQAEVLIMLEDLPANAFQGNPSGQVEIEVEYVTPAELVMRTSGKFLSQNQLPVSPQSPPETER